jgi:hypothetical protein
MRSWTRCQSIPRLSLTVRSKKTSIIKQAMTNATLLYTRVTPNNCGIRRGSGCPLRALCPNSGPRRWLSRCLCLMRRGHWPNLLPSSCSHGWWRPLFAAGRKESQSRAKRSATECSALLPHPGGVPSPSGEYLSSPHRP